MNAPLQFVPKYERDAARNLKQFVAHCRNEITAFGKNLSFDADVWDVSDSLKRKSSNSAISLVFSDWNTTRSRQSSPMSEPFKSLVKAYLRYQQAIKLDQIGVPILSSFRSLDFALVEFDLSSRPWMCSSDVLNRAATLLLDRYSPGAAYRAGRELALFVSFLNEHKLLSLPIDWRNPIPRNADKGRVGEEFDQVRKNMLPSEAALIALAKLFRIVSNPRDQLVVSVAAILSAAPDRINEVLRLPALCEVHGKLPGSGEATYGLRWFTSKGADPMIKWIVRSMYEVVQEALEKIRVVTEPAREVAAWYEENPDKMYLPPSAEHLRGCEFVTTVEVGQMVFSEPQQANATLQWLRNRGLQVTRRGRVAATIRFSEVERVIVGMLPRGFPYVDEELGLRFSDALCTFFKNALHPGRNPYVGVIDILEHGDIHSRLGSNFNRSLFQRFGFTEDDGTEIQLRSHQFRHYLNTLAQSGGLSQLDIARWSGRKSIEQNDVYDHTSDRDLIADMRSTVSEVSKFGAGNSTKNIALYDRSQFETIGLAGAHTTEFGFCLHDFAMLPCQLHEDCMNCDEQVCIKGDRIRESNIRRQLAETRHLLKLASDAATGVDVGANRWQEYQSRTLARLQELCSLLDDPEIQVGSVIRLSSANSDSRLIQSKQARLERSRHKFS